MRQCAPRQDQAVRRVGSVMLERYESHKKSGIKCQKRSVVEEAQRSKCRLFVGLLTNVAGKGYPSYQ